MINLKKSNKSKPLNTIEVYEKGTLNIIATFHSEVELIKYNETNPTHADNISVNGQVMYGWDELYMFLK